MQVDRPALGKVVASRVALSGLSGEVAPAQAPQLSAPLCWEGTTLALLALLAHRRRAAAAVVAAMLRLKQGGMLQESAEYGYYG
jgi:hypothetical protein